MNLNTPLALLLSGVVLVGAPTLRASERLHVHAAPHSSSDITVYIGVERNAENRMLRVIAESDDFFRSSEIQLDGEASPRVSVFRFQQLPQGIYEVKVELFAEGGHVAGRATCSVMVV